MGENNYKAFWDEALRQIESEYTAKGEGTNFKIWFNMEYVEDTFDQITVSVPSEFMWMQIVQRGYKSAVESKIQEITGQNISLTYTVKPSSSVLSSTFSEDGHEEKKSPQPQTYSQSYSNAQTVDTSTQTEEKESFPPHPLLNQKFTFTNFVSGENNFAYNVCLAAAKNPGKAYNPILIYGGVGLGKTHLMQSIGNYIYNEKGPSTKICYIQVENFTNEFTASIRNKTVEKFQQKYRNLDVLLLDDIQFLLDKPSVQEQLFYTFENLSMKSAQMVFTCDRPISELKGIEDRLKTRFSSGISTDLSLPNYETRYAILQSKLEQQGKSIDLDVISYIAQNVQTNIRDLEACLKKMLAWVDITGQNLSVKIVQEQLRDMFYSPSGGTITIDTIQKVVADHYNITVQDLKSKKRDKKYANPRHIAIYIAREMTENSFPDLGNDFGGRDHTTAMHSYEKVEDMLKTDSSLDTTIQMLIREIKDYKKQ